MHAENDDDLYGGQGSSEVKCVKLCDMATIFGQKNWWCKLRMMMTFMEVKGHQRSNMVTCAMATIFGQKNCWCKLRMMMTFMEVKGHQRSNVVNLLPIWYLVSRWGLGPKVCMHHFGCGMNWIKGYYMIVKVKNETFCWFSTYSMEMHSLTSSSFIICLWGETFGSRTILFQFCMFLHP